MDTKTRIVTAIEKGTVIDHIQAGQALKIVKILGLEHSKKNLTIGLKLESATCDTKDIIKIHNWHISEEDSQKVTIFSPHLSINVIDHYQVLKKYTPQLPPFISSLIACPNSQCISNHEEINTYFYLEKICKDVFFRCKFCERPFSHHTIQPQNTL